MLNDDECCKEFFLLVKDLVKTLRIFQNDSLFCENVTFLQFCILDFIESKGRLELSELNKLLSVEKSTTTRMIDPLVKKKLVKRIKSFRDCRAIELELSDNGKEVYNRAYKCTFDYIYTAINKIPCEERKSVCEGIETFIKALSSCCKKSVD